jgi:hypothetical protein
MGSKKYSNVKFSSSEEKMPITSITSVYFNEKITFMLNERIYYFGFIATETGDLYLSKEVTKQKDNNTYHINCDFIKSFNEEIQNIQFKKFIISDSEYFIITVLTKTNGYYCLLPNISELNPYELFYEELIKTQWNSLYNFNGEIISKIYFSYQYDANNGTPVSILILTDTLRLKICRFNKTLLNFDVTDIDVRSEIKSSQFNDKAFKLSDIVGVHQYFNIVFLSFKKRIYLYHVGQMKIIAVWNFEAETIVDLYIYDRVTNGTKGQSGVYYIFFLTNRSVLFTKIETNYHISLFKDNSHNILFIDKETLKEDYRYMMKVIVVNFSVMYVGRKPISAAAHVRRPFTVMKIVSIEIGIIIGTSAHIKRKALLKNLLILICVFPMRMGCGTVRGLKLLINTNLWAL